MCVPFGKILRGMAVPKHRYKIAADRKSGLNRGVIRSRLTEFPYYSPLINQIRTIKSFRRPVLLVDDLLHKGYG